MFDCNLEAEMSLFLYFFFKIFICSSWRQSQGDFKRCRRPDLNKVFDQVLYPNYYWSYFITLYMNGWCIWVYIYWLTRLILNLSHLFQILEEVKAGLCLEHMPFDDHISVVIASPYFTKISMNGTSYDTYTHDRLEYWIWSIGYSCWRRWRFLEQAVPYDGYI